jgi:hypothetical protein
MKQTAIEWLIEQWPILESQIPERILNKAKEIENEQIRNSYLTEIELQCIDPNCDGINRKGICIPSNKPKLDSEGCLIFKNKIR